MTRERAFRYLRFFEPISYDGQNFGIVPVTVVKSRGVHEDESEPRSGDIDPHNWNFTGARLQGMANFDTYVCVTGQSTDKLWWSEDCEYLWLKTCKQITEDFPTPVGPMILWYTALVATDEGVTLHKREYDILRVKLLGVHSRCWYSWIRSQCLNNLPIRKIVQVGTVVECRPASFSTW